ncbi:cell wall hydrolase [Aminipila sp.]|uniref:cell wall hydrolase n=1 Tax=Aminipila sp. TaxID=2060095 RepID=UPI00289DA497|nr:cell wall hydrolase [Aminipila sp.]
MSTITRIAAIFLTLGITLFSISPSATVGIRDEDSSYKKNPFTKSTKNNTTENKYKKESDNIIQRAEASAKPYTAPETASIRQQNTDESTDERNAVSRGGRTRNTYDEVNQKEQLMPSIEATAAVNNMVSDTPKVTKFVAQAASEESSSGTENNEAQATQAKADSQYENDLELLARLITAEAQGEPYEAKVAVGAVVLNRVESGLWASTINDVIYQKTNGYYQFTPVENGWINKPAQQESIKAAQEAMNGSDPTNGAQFYYDDKTTNTWILSKPVSVQIGHMIYAY